MSKISHKPHLERVHVVEDEADACGDDQLHQNDEEHLAHEAAPHRRICKAHRCIGCLQVLGAGGQTQVP